MPIGVAVSGAQSIGLFAADADAMIAVQPERDLVDRFDAATSKRVPKIGQQPICWECYTTCNRAQQNRDVHERLGPLRILQPRPAANGAAHDPRPIAPIRA